MFDSPISYPLYKLVSISQLSYFLIYVYSFFATQLFNLGHLNSLSLHVIYILSLFNLFSSLSNVIFLRNSLLSVFTSFGTGQFSQTNSYNEFEPMQLS